jgi:hypothetical protein
VFINFCVTDRFQDDPSEQQFQYEVKLLGASVKGGKMMPKEDLEE